MITPDQFIEYLQYLLGLHPKGRSRYKGWREMKKLLTQHGFWKKPHEFKTLSSANKMRQVGKNSRLGIKPVVQNRISTTDEDPYDLNIGLFN